MFDTCCSLTVVPWTIYGLQDDRISLQEFYQQFSSQTDDHHVLNEARIGRSKDSLDHVSTLGEPGL